MDVYFTLLDYIILGLFGLSFLIGLKRGLLVESIMFFAWFVAVFVVIIFNDTLSVYLSDYFKSPDIAAIVSFVLLCLIPLVIGVMFSYMLAFIAAKRLIGLGFASRLFGGFLGLGKNVLVVFVVVFVLTHTPLGSRDWFQQSHSVKILSPAVKWMQNHVIIPSVSEEETAGSGTQVEDQAEKKNTEASSKAEEEL